MKTTVVTLCTTLVLTCVGVTPPTASSNSLSTHSMKSADNLERQSCGSNETPSPLALDTTLRLQRLRQQMENYQITAYIVSSDDDHQSEYIANHDKRREYISGFTGSAGDAVITLKKAALWTDGRYFIQADNELDCNWLLMKSGMTGVPSVKEWIISELKEGDNVSADPRIIPFGDWSSWNSSFASAGINLKLITDNLVDQIWGKEHGREPYPVGELMVQDIKYSGKAWQEKLETVRSVMKEQDADMLIVTALDEIAWILNMRGDDVPYTPVFRAYLIIKTTCATLYLPKNKITQPILVHLNFNSSDNNGTIRVKEYEMFWTDLSEMSETVERIILPSQLSYAKGASYYIYHLLPKEKLKFAPSPILTMKEIKNEVEAKGMRYAHIRDAVAKCQMLRKVEEGVAAREDWDELKVVKTMTELRQKQLYSRGPSFSTIAAFGSNSALPHYVPTKQSNKKLNASHIFMLDSGGQYLDGTTDVTRTIHLGKPTDYQIKVYTALLKGCIDLVSTRFPEGYTLQKLEILIRAPLYYEGLEFSHGTTHGIGSFLGVHEAFNTTYQKNFFGSQEPGYYELNNFGMRLENIVTVVSANMSYQGKEFLTFEPVTLVPYDRKLINVDDLSKKEVNLSLKKTSGFYLWPDLAPNT